MKLTSLPSISTLKCFASAARHQSFTDAALELGMTQSAVSKKIKELEQNLGVPLFQRVGRGVSLTPAGQNLARDISRNLDQLENSVQKAVSAGAGKSALSIATLPTFANLWLIPRLPEFQTQYPDIQVNLSTRLEPFEFDREPFDLAFHYGLDNWPGMKMLRLFGETMVPVCTQTFFDAHNLSDHQNLLQAPLLHLQSRPSVWSEWMAEARLASALRHSGQVFDQYSMIISAALSSLGAAILPIRMIERELDLGQLRQIEGPVLSMEKSYFLVRPFRASNKAADVFEQWVQSKACDT
ncbi:LysR substrate-binding domain-containing protein [Ruegeria atlantica]|uniref:LysR substrate-binding domain-containing protein n=1 Tax=Ruegeria atlantica TaxID=81569 RepID=UPI00147FC96B|nr:LysR substrate-binding domain-containing protein [Ruegeria atlantica]